MDSETEGQPSADALGDGDDEDGVTSGSTIMVGQLDASMTVNVQNAPSGAKLDAWIDFNADGSWGGPWEQIANNLAVAEEPHGTSCLHAVSHGRHGLLDGVDRPVDYLEAKCLVGLGYELGHDLLRPGSHQELVRTEDQLCSVSHGASR